MTDHLQRLAFLSLHSSPLAVPGTTKAGGMNVYIRELTQRLGASGRQVEIFTRRDAPDAPETVDLSPNVRVVNVPAGPPRPLSAMEALEWVPQFSVSVQATAQLHDWTYDLIHSHYWLSGLAGITLADAWQRPHVSMFHTLGEIKNRARRSEREPLQRLEAERRVVQQADRVICATTHERDFLVEYYGAHADCVAVVPAGVDVEQFRPGDQAAARRALDLPDGPLVLFIGRIEPIKGVDILLRAAVETEVAQPLTVLIVGGDAADPERRRLEALSRELGLASRVLFRDAVRRADLPAYYQAADLCVVPSYYESFGLVAVEALACGIPVVATRVGGLQYTVRDGQSGYLISWRCAEPFAERMETLLGNVDLRRRFGVTARESVMRFAWPTVTDAVVDVYETLLRLHASGLGAGCRAG